MNIKVYFSMLLVFMLIALNLSASALAIGGKVTDASTNEALPGAIVSFPELQQAVSTNENGEYRFARIARKGRFLVEVRFIGYKTITQLVDLSTAEPLNFSLQPSVIEVHEVVITGTAASADNRTNSTSVTTVNKNDLISRSSNNIIDAISRVAGVSQVTTGAAVSKPIIRGLGSNRILTLSDGVKQEGQQWGDEHGIEIDQYKAGRVEILRGAASLLYGSDALGGVINIIDPLPPASGRIRAEILSNYATNNGLSATSAMLEGNSNGFVWQSRGTYKNAFSYNTPEVRIPNTGFQERNFNTLIGLNKHWGFAHLNFSSFNQKLGLPDFEKNAAGKYEDAEGNVFTSSDLRNRELLTPFQDVRHYKLALNSVLLFKSGRLRSTFGYQNNQRRELEESRVNPSLFFDLNTYSYDLKYYLNEKNGWEPAIGISGAFQNSKNKAEELLIPDYDNTDIGAFAYLKKSWTGSTFNAGLRFDNRSISGVKMEEDGTPKFSDFKNEFSNLSGAIGFTCELSENWNIKANLGSAFRAPNIAELSSEGIHEGTFRYEIGTTNLKPERSLYADAALEFHNSKVDFHFNLYTNYIGNYIYSRRLNNETINVDTETFALYRYVQDDANLYGLEAGLTFHPSSFMHIENSFSITQGKNTQTKNNLPFIPAPALRNEVKFEPELKTSGIKHPYISIGMDNIFPQNRIDKEFEILSRGYTLIDASAGASIHFNKQAVRLYLSVNNLFDKAYASHLNRLRYEGILNQGRNIAFGFQLPLNLKD
ncbi:MAG: TonB-dependent receptor [Pyrinomonadaceae bacterium]|nr:TonB-dependent receptor [Sphingobacteriaceae bacterium]